MLGVSEGENVGAADDGMPVGTSVGEGLGTPDGVVEGRAVGDTDGSLDGLAVGVTDGVTVGAPLVGILVGNLVGCELDGIVDGDAVGEQVPHMAGHLVERLSESQRLGSNTLQISMSGWPWHRRVGDRVGVQVGVDEIGEVDGADTDGVLLGTSVGPAVGAGLDGARVGDADGEQVPHIAGHRSTRFNAMHWPGVKNSQIAASRSPWHT